MLKSVIVEDGHHIAGLLSHVEREAEISQRKLARELGVALGLVNAYVKRCIRKGLIKVQRVPSRRYAYVLTPKGFAEKTRLTAEYLSWSLRFFRRAREQYAEMFRIIRQRGWTSVAFCGAGDLAEIALLRATDESIAVIAIVDADLQRKQLFNIPVVATLADLPAAPHGLIVTGIDDAQARYDAAVAYCGANFVLVPPMLAVQTGEALR